MSSKKTQQNNRVSRKEQRRVAVEQERRRRNLLIGVPIAVIVLGLLALVSYRAFQPDIAGVANFSGVQRAHDVGAKFPAGGLPPVGGIHPPSWQTCAVYNAPVDTGLAVHAMEHGAVWITYHPDLPVADVDQLAALAQGDKLLLMSPYPDQDEPLVLTAWSVQLALDSAADERILDFIGRYKGKGPEQGVTCQDGVSSTIG